MKVNAEKFDILGFLAFSSVILLSLYALITGDSLPQWALFFLLFIGVAGAIVDGTIVYVTFIKKPEARPSRESGGNQQTGGFNGRVDQTRE